MSNPEDTNAQIWQSDELIRQWTIEQATRERYRSAHREFMALLLPFEQSEAFTFLDLGAGTGAAAQVILNHYPRSRAILTDFSKQMIAEGEAAMTEFEGRFQYLEFDLTTGNWPVELTEPVDAIVTSLCIHHLSDDRKQGLFREIWEHLRPGGWYLNYDPVTSPDPKVEAAWQRANDVIDPTAKDKREHRNHRDQLRYENHIRYMIPLAPQLEYLREAGFEAVDVYWKQLENVIYGGSKPEPAA